MKKLMLSVALAAAFCAAARADDEAQAEATGDEAVSAVVPTKPAESERVFTSLPCCHRVKGRCEVLRFGARAWEPVREGDYHPLGSTYRTFGDEARLEVRFGKECSVTVEGAGSFASSAQPIDCKARRIRLVSGVLAVTLPRNLPEGLFVVDAPGFTVVNPAGESRFEYASGVKDTGGDGDEATVRCVTGTLAVKGRHFAIPCMRAANAVRIRTSVDMLFTALYGLSGDYDVVLDQGLQKSKDYDTGKDKVEAKTLLWKMTPQTAVRVHRALPALGERMSVTVMTFDAAGGLRNRCAFAEERYEVSTGELAGEAIKEKEELAKKAAAAAESAAAEKTAASAESGEDAGE